MSLFESFRVSYDWEVSWCVFEGDLKLRDNLVIATAYMALSHSVGSYVCYVTVGVG